MPAAESSGTECEVLFMWERHLCDILIFSLFFFLLFPFCSASNNLVFHVTF